MLFFLFGGFKYFMVTKVDSPLFYYDTLGYSYHIYYIFFILGIVVTYFNCYDVTDY